MIENPVYKMTRSWDCADYAFLSALRNQWVNVTEDYMKAIEGIWIANVGNHLVNAKIIANFIGISTIQWVDFWLKKWNYVIAWTGLMTFDSVRNPPYIQKFDGKKAHNFCIVPFDHPTLWKIKDSQGEWFADKWYWYMEKSDFRKIKKFRIYV